MFWVSANDVPKRIICLFSREILWTSCRFAWRCCLEKGWRTLSEFSVVSPFPKKQGTKNAPKNSEHFSQIRDEYNKKIREFLFCTFSPSRKNDQNSLEINRGSEFSYHMTALALDKKLLRNHMMSCGIAVRAVRDGSGSLSSGEALRLLN